MEFLARLFTSLGCKKKNLIHELGKKLIISKNKLYSPKIIRKHANLNWKIIQDD